MPPARPRHAFFRNACVSGTRTGTKGARVIVTISARHMEVTPALKNFAEQKAAS